MYIREIQFRHTFILFSIITILISCLGIFGLSLFACQRRIKEIGIRKVLGSSVTGIVDISSREFFRWVLIANLAAWPLSYYFMQLWLKNFAYKTQISWWIFLISGLISLCIALLTIAYQTLKTARSNPVELLRYE